MVTVGQYLPSSAKMLTKATLDDSDPHRAKMAKLQKELQSARVLVAQAKKHPALLDKRHPKHSQRVQILEGREQRVKHLQEKRASLLASVDS